MDSAIEVDGKELGLPDQVARTPSQDQMKPDGDFSVSMPGVSNKAAMFHQQRKPQNQAVDKYVEMMADKAMADESICAEKQECEMEQQKYRDKRREETG